MALLEKFTSSTTKGKNSKGFQINSIEFMMEKWTTLIISIFLTLSCRPLDVKLDMLESINGIAHHGKVYN